MPSRIVERPRVLLFLLLTVVLGGLTVRAAVRGHAAVQVLLLASLTGYALTVLLFHRVPNVERLVAVPLGVVGVAAYGVGAPTDLPVLLVLLGVGGAVDLLWDPSGTVHGSQSD
ncbi:MULTISPECIES: hypothetical protein [Haloferax]|uniref:Uncharacterized protein n=1 Tax=Haloferax massiliensis TaxID=1476858 RepID=A0A0D6JWC9_9EURY|nr:MULTISPECIES: hypothetical protein [Haloferax]MDS0240811.1 hypothetical protein [Haloferax sp. S2CR25]MDS0443932.1 hypothetical protein [Haloferax sp. S2CR25-2]CQR53715.1 hypothetical protein BN996_03757 [Haloferax massiliensis]